MKKIVIVGAVFVVAVGGIIGYGVMNRQSDQASSSTVIKIGGVFDTSGTPLRMVKPNKMGLILPSSKSMLMVVSRLRAKATNLRLSIKMPRRIIQKQRQ